VRSVLPFLALALAGCSVPPPRSPLPDANAAIARMRATNECGTGVQAAAKLDHFGTEGRVRGDVLLIASKPARLRMDIVSPFGVTLATLASDGHRFALADKREKRLYSGPATTCNIARLTQVPIPGHVLVTLLRGGAPVLKHAGSPGVTEALAAPSVQWNGGGYYVLRIPGTRGATEEVHLGVHPADVGKPWSEQRLRVLEVSVEQAGVVLYRAELEGHEPGPMAAPRVDPDDPTEPPLAPSGPQCTADLPRRLHVAVPPLGVDMLFRYDSVTWNPPLLDGVFGLAPDPALAPYPVECDD
jgi:hypothetical protein